MAPMKKTIIAILIIVVLAGLGWFFFIRSAPSKTPENQVQNPNPEPIVQQPVVDKTKTVLGKSVENRDIVAYHYGELDAPTKNVLFIGGIHGGYEWNTALVAYQAMDYFGRSISVIPAGVRATVIPVLNPDGLNKVVGTTSPFTKSDVSKSQDTVVAGRFNANEVDLNRNFDCDWQAVGKWQNKNVSGGDSAFSEPESQAIKAYIEANKPDAVVVWYSSAGGVFASNCHGGVSAETKSLTKTFADASGYPAHDNFNFYEITGDMVNWLAKNNIPAISVLLTNHEDTEWSKNQKGIDAVLKTLAQ